jgi:P pilus assembly chaperone PapD
VIEEDYTMKKLFPVLALCLTAAAHAGPSINVGTVYDYLDGDKSTYLKRVFNSGDTTAFVRVNLYEITFDADGKTTETSLENVSDDTTKRAGLIASPARLIVPPKGMQATRLLYRGERDIERYYRLRFVPVMPEKEDQFDVSDTERDSYKASMSAGVKFLAGYGTVFFVRPTQSRFDTQLHNAPDAYRVENRGNSTIELDEFTDCAAKKPKECLPAQKHHVRPGKNYQFSKVPGRVYAFKLIESGTSKMIEVGK